MLYSSVSFSQIDIGTLLEGGAADAQTLAKGFLEPVGTGFGYGLNGGWFSTAKTHKTLGFDLKVIASAAIIPENAETFVFNNADYPSGNIQLEDGTLSSALLPTIFGSKDLSDRPLLNFTTTVNGQEESLAVSALPGFKQQIEGATGGYNVMPSAIVQLGVGLFKNTDLKIRYVPKQEQKEFEFSSTGFGIMHDIKQWIPVLKKLPFHLSVFGGVNDVKGKFFLDPDDNPTQALELNTTTTMFALVASKKLAFLTVFGSVGTSSYETDLNVLGTFETTNTGEVFTDPIALNYSGSSVRGNIGVDIKLLFLNLSAEYAIQEYDTFTVTAGFTIR